MLPFRGRPPHLEQSYLSDDPKADLHQLTADWLTELSTCNQVYTRAQGKNYNYIFLYSNPRPLSEVIK